MRRPSPVTMIAAGLVSLSCAMVLVGDFFFGYLPDRQAEAATLRKRVVDNIALPATTLLSSGELDRLQAILEQYVQVNRDLRSIGVRRADGRLLLATPRHANLWSGGPPQGEPDPARVRLPLLTPKGTWGNLELRFADPPGGVSQSLRTIPACCCSRSSSCWARSPTGCTYGACFSNSIRAPSSPTACASPSTR